MEIEQDAAFEDAVVESDTEDDVDPEQCCGNRIIDMSCLQALVSAAAALCSSCKKGYLTLLETQRFGLMTECALRCNSCSDQTQLPLSRKHPNVKWHDINRKSVLAMRLIGRGRESLKKVCATLDLPPPLAKKSFDFHRRALSEAAKDQAEESMSRLSADLVTTRTAEGEQNPGDVAVSTDGTWMRRGYSSMYGVQTVISLDTKKVLDVEILSKSCSRCVSWKARLDNKTITQAAYDEWKANHAEKCQINTVVSSPAMESAAVVAIWTRSEQLRGLRYVGYIGDGDSKGHSQVVKSRPYGDTDVVKEECVGHVQKRLGKSLRDLKQRLSGQKLADDKPIAGKGRLTDKLIDSLQNYYGMAIGQHPGDFEEMKRAIWASFCHRMSCNDKPRHEYCPPGIDSWCKWQQHKAGKQGTYKHHNVIPPAVAAVMKPVYERLTDRALLERCLRGATQNVNECLNGLIWQMCPKVSFCSAQTVQTAAHLAIVLFNDGYERLDHLLDAMQCLPQSSSTAEFGSWDAKKQYHAIRKSGEIVKASRKRKRAIKKGLIDDTRQKEGAVYVPGGFS